MNITFYGSLLTLLALTVDSGIVYRNLTFYYIEIESKIAALEDTLENAVVMDDSELSTDKVSVGNTVEIHCIDNDQEYTYKIVAATEADPLKGKISDDCPLGKTLLGTKKGDSISVETPGGIRKFTITNISK